MYLSLYLGGERVQFKQKFSYHTSIFPAQAVQLLITVITNHRLSKRSCDQELILSVADRTTQRAVRAARVLNSVLPAQTQAPMQPHKKKKRAAVKPQGVKEAPTKIHEVEQAISSFSAPKTLVLIGYLLNDMGILKMWLAHAYYRHITPCLI